MEKGGIRKETKDLKLEEWKKIKGFEDYEISNLGRVRSTKFKSNKVTILKPATSGPKTHKRLYVKLCKTNVGYIKSIHRLVLETFIGNCPENMECCHNDGNGLNNGLDNLRWDTSKNNRLDTLKHKTNPLVKLKENDIIEIRKRLINRENQKDIAKKYNVSPSTISQINTGKTWAYMKT